MACRIPACSIIDKICYPGTAARFPVILAPARFVVQQEGRYEQAY
jgi:hypothetical protein